MFHVSNEYVYLLTTKYNLCINSCQTVDTFSMLTSYLYFKIAKVKKKNWSKGKIKSNRRDKVCIIFSPLFLTISYCLEVPSNEIFHRQRLKKKSVHLEIYL